ncbi:MAG: S26 family signal peptidase [Acidimicrobiia bacterium]
MQRFRVVEDSMRPTLVPGDEFVVTSSRAPRVGEIVAFQRPGRPGFWMVKRMTAGPGDPVDGRRTLGADEAWVLSDNREATEADSRTLGTVPLDALSPVVTHLDPVTFTEAVQLLGQEEPALAEIIHRHGMPVFWERAPGFPTLVWLILEQQVSLESGAAMYRRVSDLVGEITPETLARLDDGDLRDVGVTRQKTSYLLGLARSIGVGEVDLDALSSMSAEDARRVLIGIRGIGPWTADAYLLSALRLPDVFPLGDRALQVGAAETLGMSKPMTEAELEMVAEPWRPVRAVAARLIWHAYLATRGRIEPADPGAGHPASPYA